jgi:hypothetical protein
MRDYKYDTYLLRLKDTGRTGSYGKRRVAYSLENTADETGEVIFSGDDFFPSPMIDDSEGEESAVALLSFLALMDGDTDDEYFEKYTPRQIKFRDTEAEALQEWGRELEARLNENKRCQSWRQGSSQGAR